MARSFREIYQALREEINIPPKKLGPGTGQADQRGVLSPSGNKITMSSTDADNKGKEMINKLKNSHQELPSAASSTRAGLVHNTGQKPASIGDQGVRRPISGTNDVKTRLANARNNPPALDSTQKTVAQSQAPMRQATNPNADGNGKISSGGVGSSLGKQSGSGTTIKPVPKSPYNYPHLANATKPAQPPSNFRQAPAAAKPSTSGQAQAAAPEKKVMPSGSIPKTSNPPTTTKTAPAAKETFAQAFAKARKQAGGAGGKFTWTDPKTGKTKEYQTNVKGEKYRKASTLKKV